jgi:hypothetical protein
MHHMTMFPVSVTPKHISNATPPLFLRPTLQITVVPRFCVVNLLRDGPLLLRQRGAHTADPLCIAPGAHAPWHWPDQRAEKVSWVVIVLGTSVTIHGWCCE